VGSAGPALGQGAPAPPPPCAPVEQPAAQQAAHGRASVQRPQRKPIPAGKRGRPSAHVATRQAQPLGRHPPGTLRDRPHESPTPPGHQTRCRDAHLQGRPARQGRQQQMRAGTDRYGCETRCRGAHLCRQPDRRGSEHSGGCPGTVRNAEAMWHLRKCRRLQRAGAGTCAVVGLGARDHCLTQPAGRCERVDSQDMPRVEGKEMCGSR
jgi:hypothetical protein